MKSVVVYGNCHTEVIAEMLNSNEYFNKCFRILPIKPVHLIDTDKYFEEPAFAECDIFIHQAIRLNNRYGEEYASERVIRRLKPGCRVIAIPNVYHLPTCFFPQYIDKRGFVIRNQVQSFRDRIIEEGRKKGYSVNEICEEYESESLYRKEDVVAEYNKFIDKVRFREMEWDIKVSDFIEENYKTHQLFYDPNHPTNYFLAYITNEILNILLENTTGNKNYIENMDLDKIKKLDTYEMPVTASVRKCLDIKNGYNILFRDTGNRLRNKEIDLQEYIRQYLAVRWPDKSLPLSERGNSFVHWFIMKSGNKINNLIK